MGHFFPLLVRKSNIIVTTRTIKGKKVSHLTLQS
jgi:hypothetical protein